MLLDPIVEQEIVDFRDRYLLAGDMQPADKLVEYYATFRRRFGPDALAGLDGVAFLEVMHLHGNKDSLVYWLEFKNDEEMPAIFGSIGGGSALKFGIYRRAETGQWMTGSAQQQRVLSVDEAIDRARQHRDQLIRGAELLQSLPSDASDDAYAALQHGMIERAPLVAESAWGHKYFSLLYPEKLDDFHNTDYQRYHLIRLLQVPPNGDGRYLPGGRFVSLAHEFGIPMNNLMSILYGRNGSVRKYWRIGTSDGTTPRTYWSDMRDGAFVAIGWPALGDLSGMPVTRGAKDSLRQRMQDAYPDAPQTIGRLTQQIFNFVAHIDVGDIVLAGDGVDILGVGRISGDYRSEPAFDLVHQRPVEWLDVQDWRLPTPEGVQTVVAQIYKEPRNLVEVERHILEPLAPPPQRPPTLRAHDGTVARTSVPTLTGVLGRIQAVMERKGQVILYGPPGTGKTYWGLAAARELAALHAFGDRFEDLSTDQRTAVLGSGTQLGLVRTATFHPAYGYEDFLEGYRPVLTGEGMIAFALRDGIFKRLCRDAESAADRRFYLLIDEINRGDIPRIFGELLTVLEKDKRGQTVLLGVSGQPFKVPENVYLVGTMNTADRSIALLDAALRRRFGFVELMPNGSVLGKASVGGVPLGRWLDALNLRIREHAGRDARNLQVGHAYLLEDGNPIEQIGRFAQVLRDDIIPLLEEYTYEDYAALAKILGLGMVDTQRQRIREEVFESGRTDELIQCLLEPNPEIATAPEALDAEAASEAEAEVEEEAETVADSAVITDAKPA